MALKAKLKPCIKERWTNSNYHPGSPKAHILNLSKNQKYLSVENVSLSSIWFSDDKFGWPWDKRIFIIKEIKNEEV